MDYTYHPQNVCPMEIRFRLEDDTVHDIRFVGGCNGNLEAGGRLDGGKDRVVSQGQYLRPAANLLRRSAGHRGQSGLRRAGIKTKDGAVQ